MRVLDIGQRVYVSAYECARLSLSTINRSTRLTLAWPPWNQQGWRRSMEDAHLAVPALDGDESAAVFGVFDGHGGTFLFIRQCLLSVTSECGVQQRAEMEPRPLCCPLHHCPSIHNTQQKGGR